MCNEHVHKHELKSVRVVQTHDYKEGSQIKFNLMVRSKGSIVVKDKSLATKAQEEEKTPKMYANRFANETE